MPLISVLSQYFRISKFLTNYEITTASIYMPSIISTASGMQMSPSFDIYLMIIIALRPITTTYFDLFWRNY